MRWMLVLLASGLMAETFEIRPAAGDRIYLEIYKTGLMRGKKHDIYFERYQGKVDHDAASPEKSKVELTIEVASISVRDTWLSESKQKDVREHAVGKDGLQADKHPRMSFVSGPISRQGDGYASQGTLTIRGMAKPVTVMVTAAPDGDKLVITGKAIVKFTAYGMKPPSAALGLIGTKDEMDISFRVAGVRP